MQIQNHVDDGTRKADGLRRRFRHDSLGRLTHQKLAEAAPTLDDAGQYVGEASGQ
jgi:hypothetical protein